jgi:hypothetical protein
MCMLMCIHMLTKRTQILFDQQLWTNLMQLAKEKNTSIGELVRNAVRKQYSKDEKQERIEKAVENIFRFREKYGKKLAKGKDSAQIIREMRNTRYGKGI